MFVTTSVHQIVVIPYLLTDQITGPSLSIKIHLVKAVMTAFRRLYQEVSQNIVYPLLSRQML